MCYFGLFGSFGTIRMTPNMPWWPFEPPQIGVRIGVNTPFWTHFGPLFGGSGPELAILAILGNKGSNSIPPFERECQRFALLGVLLGDPFWALPCSEPLQDHDPVGRPHLQI